MKTNNEIKIYLAEGSPALLDALQYFIKEELNYTIIGTANNIEDIIDNTSFSSANIVILDVHLSNNRGFSAAKYMFCHNHRTKIIALTMNDESIHLYDLIVMGFRGVVTKDKISEQLDKAIVEVDEGRFFFPRGVIV